MVSTPVSTVSNTYDLFSRHAERASPSKHKLDEDLGSQPFSEARAHHQQCTHAATLKCLNTS